MVGKFLSRRLGQIVDHDKPFGARRPFLDVLTQQITLADDGRELID
jgi:hypothetical protein